MLALIQFDSCALPLLERMLEDGRLPILADLRRRGEWHAIDAKSTILQSSTYPTLCTGVDVREHGVYSAIPWSAPHQRARSLYDVPHPATIWERLSRSGRRSLIIDPYLAWAPREMLGAFLSGVHFTDRMVVPAASVPGGIRRAILRRQGRAPRLDDVYGRPQAAALCGLCAALTRAPRRAAGAAIDLLARDDFELIWLNFSVAHKAGHHLWDPAAVLAAPMDADARSALGHGIEGVYRAIDEALGRVLEVLPRGTDVIVFSPTGMGPNTSLADILPDMLEAVLAGAGGMRASGAIRSSTPIWSLRARVPAGLRTRVARWLPDRMAADLATRLYARTDWRRTRAFALPGENKGYIRVNLRGREQAGIVAPSEVDELLDSIAEGLASFRLPDGSPSIAGVERASRLAGSGSCLDCLPDLVISWGDRPAAGVTGVGSPRFGDVRRVGIGSGRSGNHVDEAWALVVPGRSRARHPGRALRITDIGATACGLLGADRTGLSGAPLLEPSTEGT